MSVRRSRIPLARALFGARNSELASTGFPQESTRRTVPTPPRRDGGGETIVTRRLWVLAAMLLAAVGCRDAAVPPSAPKVAGPQFDALVASPTAHVIHQSPSAPPLQTYQVSFWAYRGSVSIVTVNYQPAPGQTAGQPFLRFVIPQFGLLTEAGGAPLGPADSVLMILTVDPVSFAVDFEPSGVVFNPAFPATLSLWYENANPDMDGDGHVDATDQMLARQLAVWWQEPTTGLWFEQPSTNDTTQLSVTSALYHFSEYAVSW